LILLRRLGLSFLRRFLYLFSGCQFSLHFHFRLSFITPPRHCFHCQADSQAIADTTEMDAISHFQRQLRAFAADITDYQLSAGNISFRH